MMFVAIESRTTGGHGGSSTSYYPKYFTTEADLTKWLLTMTGSQLKSIRVFDATEKKVTLSLELADSKSFQDCGHTYVR